MSATSRLIEAVFQLPTAVTRRIAVTNDRRVRMRDGTILLADHYAPDIPDAATVLIRTPYGRRGAMIMLGHLIAERGFHVVIQSCRGTYGSGGVFEPLVHERDDGLDTVDWLRHQPWYAGRFGLFGASYQGFAQWAVAAEAGDDLRAIVAVVTASQFRDSTYAGGSFSLDSVLTWAELLQAQAVPWWSRQVELKRGQPRLRAGLAHLPLVEADSVATGGPVAFFREWLEHTEVGTEYWRRRGFDERLVEVRAPVTMVSGWHDIFLQGQLADYAELRRAGVPAYLVIGPWTHGSLALFATALREGLRFFRVHLSGARSVPRDRPVRVHVGGGVGWRDLADWPPPHEPRRWHLHAGGGLAEAPPAPSTPDGHPYDPADPTPSIGGAVLVANRAGQVDNRPVEARPDVLVFTGTRLSAPVDLAGPVTATVYVRSTVDHYDVFVRLCDVDSRGRSWNVCDGLTRVTPTLVSDVDGVRAVRVELWPTAYRFRPGHRIRVQVSGGAHPRYARNLGTGEPLATARLLRAGEREVFHDPEHPSAITLPISAIAPPISM